MWPDMVFLNQNRNNERHVRFFFVKISEKKIRIHNFFEKKSEKNLKIFFLEKVTFSETFENQGFKNRKILEKKNP